MSLKMARTVVPVLGVALLLAVAQPAQATIARALTLEELTQRADIVAVVTVEAAKSQWTEDGFRIVTISEVVVRDAVHGTTQGARLRVQTLGGRVDSLAQVVPGTARLDVGEVALVFLQAIEQPATNSQIYAVVGLAQGKLRVERDPESSAEIVVQELGNLTLANVVPVGDGTRARITEVVEPSAPMRLPLPEVLDAIAHTLGAR